MRQREKSQQSKRRILDSAMQEFGQRNYTEASLNTICSANGISKGMVYHHFRDKDELYLACVSLCFERLTEHLNREVAIPGNDVQGCLQTYFDARLSFFRENPAYLKVFCGAVIDPPGHLKAAIAEIRKAFDALNRKVLAGLLRIVHLRPGMTEAGTVEAFCMLQDFLHSQFQTELLRRDEIDQVMLEYEAKCHLMLDILLYGVVAGSKG